MTPARQAQIDTQAPPAGTIHQPAGTIYQPDLVVVEEITDETPDTRTYRLRFTDAAKAAGRQITL